MINADADHFDVANAYLCALASDAAHLPPMRAEAALSALGFRNTTTVSDPRHAMQYTVASNSRLVLVTFRGTNADAPDWWSNFDAGLVPWPPTGRDAPDDAPRVYAGFSDTFDVSWPGLLRAVTIHATAGRDASAPKAVWITGHGRGGAFATLAAYELSGAGHRVGAVYTFGQPRVGNAAFAAQYASRQIPHYRVVHRFDAVPELPYVARDDKSPAHPDDLGTYVGLQRDGVLSPDPPRDSSDDQAARVRGLLELRSDLVNAHSIRSRYLQSLFVAARLPGRANRAEWRRADVDYRLLPHPVCFEAAVDRYRGPDETE